MMQTGAVIDNLRLHGYIRGKLLQALLSAGISASLVPVLFHVSNGLRYMGAFLPPLIVLLCLKYLPKHKKVVAFPDKRVYNDQKADERIFYAVSQKN